MQYLRLLLLPFSFIYVAVIWLRNRCYDTGLFSSRRFDIPVISIGNLAVGGAGKSPMAEYLIELLRSRYKVAVLSRGYGRSTKGFRIVKMNDTSAESGDEPMQFRRKFPEITVAVSEKRVIGIDQLQAEPDVIILDDAYQHRAVKPGLSILLFDYTSLNDFFLVLPAGNLREPLQGKVRADLIVVSKCPENLTEDEKARIRHRIKPASRQHLFFSYLIYGNLQPLFSGEERILKSIDRRTSIVLISGIANPVPLVKHLEGFAAQVIHHEYPDHHSFSAKNILKLAEEFSALPATDKVIITTEKDFQRLQRPALIELLKDLPVYYLPVQAKIHQPDEAQFNMLIESYVKRSI